jgi:hypothetical protein
LADPEQSGFFVALFLRAFFGGYFLMIVPDEDDDDDADAQTY